MDILKSDAVDIAYRIDGVATKPWIILSNSLATDHTMWDGQLEMLTRSHRVLRYDTRGHGQSSAPSGPYSFSDLADDVIRLMDELEIERADFLGLSLGGMTALELALSHADRLNRYICCDARADAPDAYKAMWPANIERARAGGMAAVAGPTLERWFSEGFRADGANTKLLDRVGAMIQRTSVDGFAGCASALMTLDFLPKLPHINVPALYIVGETDPAAPPDVMRAMANATPGANVGVIPNAAHLSNIEAPDAFNTILRDWLDSA